jgi:hypothetical protein
MSLQEILKGIANKLKSSNRIFGPYPVWNRLIQIRNGIGHELKVRVASKCGTLPGVCKELPGQETNIAHVHVIQDAKILQVIEDQSQV